MAGGEFGYKVTRKDSTILDLGAYIGGGGDTIGTVLALIPSSESITELSATLGGTILGHDVNVGDSGATFSNNYLIFYDATPDPDPTYSIVKMYHNGIEYETGGGGGGGGHDYSWETKTITSGAVELGLRTIVEPNSNFTLNAPSDLQDGMEYVLRCVNGSTAYTLTLGTGFVNNFSTDLTLHANHSDQFTFVAVDGSLELQPEYVLQRDLLSYFSSDATISIIPSSLGPSSTKGPCPEGYHIPTKEEWTAVREILNGLSISRDKTYKYLKMISEFSRRNINGNSETISGYGGYYWSSTPASVGYNRNSEYGILGKAHAFYPQADATVIYDKKYGFFIRPFKDSAVVPTSSRTTLYNGSSVATGAGIFHSAAEELISLSLDGTNWITIADKDLGSSSVSGQGGVFQWGNNAMFNATGTLSNTSNTRVDNLGKYGPKNRYNSDTFITGYDFEGWSLFVDDSNLWGYDTLNNNGPTKIKNNQFIIVVNVSNRNSIDKIQFIHDALKKYGNVYIATTNTNLGYGDDPYYGLLRYQGYMGDDWWDIGGSPAYHTFSSNILNDGRSELRIVGLSYGESVYDGSLSNLNWFIKKITIS